MKILEIKIKYDKILKIEIKCDEILGLPPVGDSQAFSWNVLIYVYMIIQTISH